MWRGMINVVLGVGVCGFFLNPFVIADGVDQGSSSQDGKQEEAKDGGEQKAKGKDGGDGAKAAAASAPSLQHQLDQLRLERDTLQYQVKRLQEDVRALRAVVPSDPSYSAEEKWLLQMLSNRYPGQRFGERFDVEAIVRQLSIQPDPAVPASANSVGDCAYLVLRFPESKQVSEVTIGDVVVRNGTERCQLVRIPLSRESQLIMLKAGNRSQSIRLRVGDCQIVDVANLSVVAAR
ncbi:MAG: hypothetical protein KDA96_04465 [Planctomycetaceae bacterium]|nr:hypothetical protein [Planctomycetaceae bacterium]